MLKLNRCCRDHKLLALRMSYFFANFRQVCEPMYLLSQRALLFALNIAGVWYF